MSLKENLCKNKIPTKQFVIKYDTTFRKSLGNISLENRSQKTVKPKPGQKNKKHKRGW